MGDVTCSNPRHPDGAWHPATPLPHPCWWRWRSIVETWKQRRNVRRWGCTCHRKDDHE